MIPVQVRGKGLAPAKQMGLWVVAAIQWHSPLIPRVACNSDRTAGFPLIEKATHFTPVALSVPGWGKLTHQQSIIGGINRRRLTK
jgi:hypothetical protein